MSTRKYTFNPVKEEIWFTERAIRAIAQRTRITIRRIVNALYSMSIPNLTEKDRGTITIGNWEGNRIVRRKFQVYNLNATYDIIKNVHDLAPWQENFKNDLLLECSNARGARFNAIDYGLKREQQIYDVRNNKIVRIENTMIEHRQANMFPFDF